MTLSEMLMVGFYFIAGVMLFIIVVPIFAGLKNKAKKAPRQVPAPPQPTQKEQPLITPGLNQTYINIEHHAQPQVDSRAHQQTQIAAKQPPQHQPRYEAIRDISDAPQPKQETKRKDWRSNWR